MIRAVFCVAEQGRWLGCSIRGHAGFAPHGSDIVCAGVSALAIGIVNGIVRAGIPAQVTSKDGEIYLLLDDGLNNEQDLVAQALLETLFHGLYDVAQQYPKRVVVHKEKHF